MFDSGARSGHRVSRLDIDEMMQMEKVRKTSNVVG